MVNLEWRMVNALKRMVGRLIPKPPNATVFGGLGICRSTFARIAICLCFFLAGFSSSIRAGVSVEISATEHAVRPGDLVEVSVTDRSREYGSRVLREPTHAAFRTVAVQAFPVRLNENSEYEHRWKVVYQALRSGEVLLEGGFIEYPLGGDTKRSPLEAAEIDVTGFGAETDHDGVEQLGGAALAYSERAFSAWVYAIFAIAVLITFFGWRARSRKLDMDSEADSPLRSAVVKLQNKLKSGELPRLELERFLVDFGKDCSSRLVSEIERAVYSKNGSALELDRLIGKDFSK